MAFGLLAIWPYGHSAMWPFGHLVYLAIWPFGHVSPDESFTNGGKKFGGQVDMVVHGAEDNTHRKHDYS